MMPLTVYNMLEGIFILSSGVYSMGEQRIVLVARDATWRNNIKSILNRSGYYVVGEAGDGLTALKMIRSRQPELVIMEPLLPGMDGLEVARIVHEDKLAPVVLIATTSQAELVDKAKRANVFAFLVSPIEETTLVPTIELTITKYKELVKLEAQVAELKETLETRKIVERAKGILMEKHGLNEPEAFNRMRKQSMNKRVSMRVIADAIILANNL